jgi:hypothetical protein
MEPALYTKKPSAQSSTNTTAIVYNKFDIVFFGLLFVLQRCNSLIVFVLQKNSDLLHHSHLY